MKLLYAVCFLLLLAGTVGMATADENRFNAAPILIPTVHVYAAQWGSQGSGDGQFNEPGDVAVDGAGNVYVVDSGNNRVQEFTTAGTFITKWGTQGSGDGQFNDAKGIATDPTGNVYVIDSGNNRIQQFTAAGDFVSQRGVNGTGVGEPFRPVDVAVDGKGNLYVTDEGNDQILMPRMPPWDSRNIGMWGSSGTGNEQFNDPAGIAADSSGNVYVVDSGNNRIQRFDWVPPTPTQGSGVKPYLGITLILAALAVANRYYRTE